jgi:hypothetical protein
MATEFATVTHGATIVCHDAVMAGAAVARMVTSWRKRD